VRRCIMLQWVYRSGLQLVGLFVLTVCGFSLDIVTCYSRWSFTSEGEDLPAVNLVNGDSVMTSNSTDDVLLQGYILK
jgi:hypothetical protein